MSRLFSDGDDDEQSNADDYCSFVVHYKVRFVARFLVVQVRVEEAHACEDSLNDESGHDSDNVTEA